MSSIIPTPGGIFPGGGGSGGDGSPGAVRYDVVQALSDPQKGVARVNIGAASGVDLTAEIAARIAADALKVDKTTTVNGHALSGNVTVTKADVGLGNADNTSDANKPVSTAQQTALNLKADKSTTITAGTGLTGGGDLSANRTVSIAAGGVGTTQLADAGVTLAKLANLAQATIIGRAAGGGTGVPAALTGAQVAAIVGNSTETFAGVAEIATQAEADTGTDDARMVTPLKLKTQLGKFAGTGTAGEVATLDAAGKTQRGSGVTIAPAASRATATQLVRGDDLALGMPGGIRYTAATSSTDGAPIPSGTDFSAVWVGTPEAGSFLNFKNTSGNRVGVALVSGIWRFILNGSADTGTALTIPSSASFYRLDFTASIGVYRLHINGALVYTSAGSQLSCTNVMPIGWGSAFTGWARLGRYANFIQTDTEALGAACEESVGRLAYKGYMPTAITTSTAMGGYSPYDAFSYSSGTYTVDVVSGVSTSQAVASVDLKAGQSVTLTIDAASVGTYAEIAFHNGGGSVLSYELGVGNNTLTFTAPADGLYTVGIHSPGIQPAGTIVFTASSLVLGTVANYAPENCLPSGAWPDSSENCHDLAPVGGAIALNPRDSYTRRIAVTVAGATLTAGAAPATIGAVTGATAADTAALAAIKQWDSVSAGWRQACPANAGGIDAIATAAGTVSLVSFALGSNATVSAATAVQIVHTQY